MLMSGKNKIVVDTTTVADGDSIASYLTDAAGAFLTSTLVGAKQSLDVLPADNKAEDTAHASGDMGSFILAVRNDGGATSLTSADGDYSPVAVDEFGRILTTTTVDFSFDYAEDSAAVSGDIGAYVLTVRQDTLATSTSADGDFASFKVNSLGSLYTHDTSANTTLTAILADTATIDSNIATLLAEFQAITYAEDSAAASGDMGISTLLVRQDTLAASTSADGDYGTFKSNNLGELYVFDTTTHTTLASILTEVSATNDVQYAEDSAHTSGAIGNFVLGVRKDSFGADTSATGDYSALQTWSNGELKVVNVSNGSILQQQKTVTTTATTLPTAALANRKSILIQNTGATPMFVGSATVTSSGATTGIEIPRNSFIELECGPAVTVYGIVNGGTTSANILESA